MPAADHLHPEQLKMFYGATELQDAITHSHDVKRHGTYDDEGKVVWNHESMPDMWARKLNESKASGLHDSITESGFVTKPPQSAYSQIGLGLNHEEPHKLVGAGYPNYPSDEPTEGLRVSDGHHRIAAAADIERTTGRNVWIPVSHREGITRTRKRANDVWKQDVVQGPEGVG